ncbi:MAG: hypothetical protein GYA62_17230 [Bacteroidales bacterium]|nr:hypothetical protein [Bacteroidales bacterium]
MANKAKTDSELDEERIKRKEQQANWQHIINLMLQEFSSRYQPATSPEGCDLKTTTEIADMFSTVAHFEESLIAVALNQHGYRFKLIGNEFRWMLKPIQENTNRA